MKILVTATNFSTLCKGAYEDLLKKGVEVVENTKGRPYEYDELVEVVGDIDGVIAGVDTWNEDVFKHAPKLKSIARFGVGVDNIDLESAKKRGIKVSNCKGINANSVAEHAVGLLLSMLRQIPMLDATTRQGKWVRTACKEINELTVGFLGFGEIAQKTAIKIKAFDAKMLAYDKYPNMQAADKLGVEMVDVERLYAECDVISIHVPSIPETKKMINKAVFDKMKDGSYIINTARGEIVDEDALYNALSSGKLAMAGLDVYCQEPIDKNNPLLTLENIVVTPHAGAEALGVYDKSGWATSQALLDVFDGKDPQNYLNK